MDWTGIFLLLCFGSLKTEINNPIHSNQNTESTSNYIWKLTSPGQPHRRHCRFLFVLVSPSDISVWTAACQQGVDTRIVLEPSLWANTHIYVSSNMVWISGCVWYKNVCTIVYVEYTTEKYGVLKTKREGVKYKSLLTIGVSRTITGSKVFFSSK
jgi:hypothetical protein